VILIGHEGHPEVEGTMGQFDASQGGRICLVEDVADVEHLNVRDPSRVGVVTQTTLSVDDTADIVAALKARFPEISAPHKEDICYATTNRQDAVKAVAEAADVLLVLGSANSSNSVRLVEVGKRAGAREAYLIDDASQLDMTWLEGARVVGVTAGASAPELLVQGLIERLSGAFEVEVTEIETARETVSFKLPRQLAD
jgi:4-hydroxy-3-methylbut-2-enyl diphosphate reductase